ncbi:MAG: signal peptidase I, partial [Desulfurococcaceae archaeon]
VGEGPYKKELLENLLKLVKEMRELSDMKGDLVIIVRVKPEDIGVGDIIVFRTPNGRLVVHRVIDVVEVDGRKYYVTMGDNNRVRDVYYPVGVPYDRVIGKLMSFNGAVFKIPYLGHLSLLFKGS